MMDSYIQNNFGSEYIHFCSEKNMIYIQVMLILDQNQEFLSSITTILALLLAGRFQDLVEKEELHVLLLVHAARLQSLAQSPEP